MDLVYWTQVQTWVTLGKGVVLFFTLLLLLWQIHQSNRANLGQAFSNLISWVQREEIRAARGSMFDLADKPLNEWEQEDKLEVEKVCHTYDTFGIMVREKIIPRRIAVYWRQSVKRSWEISEPLIKQYRKERNDDTLWGNFSWLAQQFDGPKNKEIKMDSSRRVARIALSIGMWLTWISALAVCIVLVINKPPLELELALIGVAASLVSTGFGQFGILTQMRESKK